MLQNQKTVEAGGEVPGKGSSVVATAFSYDTGSP